MERQTFGRYLWEHGGCQDMIADSVSDLEAACLLADPALCSNHGCARLFSAARLYEILLSITLRILLDVKVHLCIFTKFSYLRTNTI